MGLSLHPTLKIYWRSYLRDAKQRLEPVTYAASIASWHQWARVAHGRTRMIVFPVRRSVGLRAVTASSRVEMLPMFVRSRPSRTR